MYKFRLGVVACGLVWAAAAHAQLVEAPAGLAQEVIEPAKAVDAIVPLKPLDGATLTSVETLRVEVANLSQLELRPGFTPSLTNGAVHVDVNPSLAKRPGPYTVTLGLHGTTDKGPATQSIALVLSLPSARLRAIPPISQDSERWPFPVGDRVTHTLRLREVSERAGIDALVVEQVDDATHGEGAVSARFVAHQAPRPLPPSGSTDVTLTATEVFPVGKTKGAIEIRSPQLADTITVPFEIRTRVYEWIIVPWFVLMGLLGYLIRYKLKELFAFGELKLTLKPLEVRAEKQSNTHPEPAERDRVAAALTRFVGEAQKARTREGLQKAVNDLSGVLETAEKARAAFLEAASLAVAPASAALEPDWSLPSAVDLEPSRSALGTVTEHIRADAADQVEAASGAASDAIGALFDRLRDFVQAASSALADLGRSGELPPPAARKQEVEGGLQEVEARCAAFKERDPQAPFAVEPALRTAHDVNRGLIGLANLLQDSLSSELTAIAGVVPRSSGADLVRQLRDAVAITPLNDNDGAAYLRGATEALRSFARRVASFVEKDATDADLAAGRYAGAVKKKVAPPVLRDALVPISATTSGTLEMAPFPGPAPARVPLEVGRLQHGVSLALPRPSPIDVVIGDAEAQLTWLRAVRGIVTTLIVSVVAWALYRDAWTGTAGDFLAVAAGGFFTDFTLDAALESFLKLRKG